MSGNYVMISVTVPKEISDWIHKEKDRLKTTKSAFVATMLQQKMNAFDRPGEEEYAHLVECVEQMQKAIDRLRTGPKKK